MSYAPSYLPPPIAKGDPFATLYACRSLDISTGSTTMVRRISPNASFEHVYSRLPSAPDHEFFGYLTRSQIAYGVGEAAWAPSVGEKDCQFHTHPTSARNADTTSALDVYAFLKLPVRRAITVGREFIWWWDKDQKLAKLVRRLLNWEEKNLLAACARVVSIGNITSLYPLEALEAIGCDASQIKGPPSEWTRYLETNLDVETKLFEVTSRVSGDVKSSVPKS